MPGDRAHEFAATRDIRVMEKLPRNATGKIMRRELKATLLRSAL
jgi:acyl-coenzyme A synthetase/AMP-(fatty) acid ligase